MLPQGMNHDDDPSIQLDWNQFKYIVFDVPNRMGTYQERYSLLGISLFVCLIALVSRSNGAS